MSYPRTPTVIRDCIYIIRADGRDESVPYAYGMYAAIVYVQSIFTPRTPTVGSRFIVPAYYGIHGVGISLFHLFCFSFVP